MELLTDVKPMPILVPIIPRFGVRLTKTLGVRDTKVPEKNP